MMKRVLATGNDRISTTRNAGISDAFVLPQQSIGLGQTFFLGYLPVSLSQTVAGRVEALIHTADAGKQLRIHHYCIVVGVPDV
jgi:hypothetical protein